MALLVHHWLHPAAVTATTLLALVAAGCGSSKKDPPPSLHTAAVSRAITRSILSERGIPATVACPPQVPVRTGHRFVCMARLAVGEYPVDVIETNGRGGVRYSNATPLRVLDIQRVELAIKEAVRKQRRLSATIVCPSPVLQQAGLVFTCTATTKKGAAPFVVTELTPPVT